jgi:hypothetical protein
MSRLSEFNRISSALIAHSNEQLQGICQQAKSLSSRTARLNFNGSAVFIKRIALTAREWHLAENKPTENLFDLPMIFHYGVGSRGFGAWREWHCHQLATEWVLSGQSQQFPLLYDWRIFPRLSNTLLFDDLVRKTEWEAWARDPYYGIRLEELQQAPAELVLFLEYIPQRLSDYIHTDNFPILFEKLLPLGEFMQSKAFIHFDAHFENILTDGNEIYLSDFGLALSNTFALARDEREFFENHRLFDRYFIILNYLHAMAKPRFVEERTWVDLPEVCPDQGAWARAYWPLGRCLDQFYRKLYQGNIHAVYPRDELARLDQAATRQLSS